MSDGTIERDGKGCVVTVTGDHAHLLEQPGVICENQDAEPGKRIYTKRFIDKRVFLPHEYEQAVQELLVGTDVLVLGMNGYSSLTDEQCRAWGVQPGAYEAACEGILRAAYRTLGEGFEGIDVRIVHGASWLGIDGCQIRVAKALNRPQLGHSCPRFMFYVADGDQVPVYVARNQAEYAERFIDSLQILIACNGRAQAFGHDIDAVFKKLKHVIPVNVLKSISTTGGPPAIGPNGKIEDAVAAFEQRVHMVAQQIEHQGSDRFIELVSHICDVTSAIARQTISPERAFRNVMPTFAWKRTR